MASPEQKISQQTERIGRFPEIRALSIMKIGKQSTNSAASISTNAPRKSKRRKIFRDQKKANPSDLLFESDLQIEDEYKSTNLIPVPAKTDCEICENNHDSSFGEERTLASPIICASREPKPTSNLSLIPSPRRKPDCQGLKFESEINIISEIEKKCDAESTWQAPNQLRVCDLPISSKLVARETQKHTSSTAARFWRSELSGIRISKKPGLGSEEIEPSERVILQNKITDLELAVRRVSEQGIETSLRLEKQVQDLKSENACLKEALDLTISKIRQWHLEMIRAGMRHPLSV